MSSEVPEGVVPSPDRPSRRGGEGGAPVSGALTIVLAVIAVVAGFLILRAITNDGDGDSSLPSSPGGTSETMPDDDEDDPSATTTTEPAPTTTTEPPLVTEGAVVVVANANNVNGSAGAMSDLLGGAGFEMGTPTNASTGLLEATVIYFDPANESSQTVAESVNRVLGGDSAISQVGTPAQTESGELDGDVLVLLGTDKAGSTLEELAPTAAGDEETTVTAPEVSGDDGDTEPGTTDPGTTDPENTDG